MSETGNPLFQINLLTLRFPNEKERVYWEDFLQRSLPQIRFGLILALILYPLFGILDYLLIPDGYQDIWLIRYAVVCPYLLGTLLISFTPVFKKAAQPILVSAVLMAGFGIIAMTVMAYPPGSYYYYAGLILVVMWAYTVLALQFIYAIFAAWSIFLVYEIVAIGLGATPLPILISNNFFFLSANIIGMVACYLIEYYKRKGFCQRLWLEEERAKTDGLLLQLRDELILAGEVQKNLLPPPALNWQDRELICYLKPSQQVGGDFYSYHEYNDGRFALALGDVAGHGMPAALLMAACISLYGATLSQDLDPCALLARLDNDLEPYVERNHQNCAFCYLVLEKGELFAVNAGGIPPFIHHADGAVEHLKVGGFPLGHGLGKSYGYQGVQVRLHPGDSIVLVSDGVIETIGKNGEMYGFKRLEDTLTHAPDGSARAIADHLIWNVSDFSDESVAQDDLTIAVLTLRA